MGIDIIKQEIKIIIETLGEQYAVINQQSGKIPQIELDIIMANIRKLYERLCDLNKLNSLDSKNILSVVVEEVIHEKEMEPAEVTVDHHEIEQIIEKTEIVLPVEEIIKPEPTEIILPVQDDLIPESEVVKPVEEIVEPITPEIKLDITKEILAEAGDVKKEEEIFPELKEKKTSPDPKEEKSDATAPPVKKSKSGKKDDVDLFSLNEKETVADKFKEVQKSMHDKISTEKPDKTLADKIGRASIVNLKTAIGINDKFLFINELFKGDIQEYNKTIDKLNSYAMLEETTGFLDELKEKFKWDEKPDAYQKLEDLLIRKFL
jgi:hypothetical protein